MAYSNNETFCLTSVLIHRKFETDKYETDQTLFTYPFNSDNCFNFLSK